MFNRCKIRLALGGVAACLALAGHAAAQPLGDPPDQPAPEAGGEVPADVAADLARAGAERAELERRLGLLEETLAELRREAEAREAREARERAEARKAQEAAAAEVAAALAAPPPPTRAGYVLGEGLVLGGYLQSEYRHRADSEDQYVQGVGLRNHNRFLVRRSRVRLTANREHVGAVIELDGNTTAGGYQVSVRRSEAHVQYRPDPARPPLVKLAGGVMDTAFGHELVESSRERPFMERSLMVRSMWPSPADVGARLSGGYLWFRYTAQALNGEPRGQRQGFPGLAPTSSKDLLLRLGVEAPLRPGWMLTSNVTSVRGRGFHRGTDASKGGLGWRDQNEDGVIQPQELDPISGRAGASAETFPRWALGVDAQLRFRTSLGDGMVYGEVILAQNMDRGMFYSNPVLTGLDQRMFGYSAAFWQEIAPYGLVGFRYDVYDPNSDLFDQRAGRLHPHSQRVQTYAPVIGLQLPERARLLFQYEHIRDRFGRDEQGVPADVSNDAWTVRLQVEL
jgi:hypothetical protein